MGLTETLIRGLAVAVLGDTRLPYQGTEYNLSKPLSRMTVKEAILRFNPDMDPATSGSLDLARRVPASAASSSRRAGGSRQGQARRGASR